MKKILYSSVVFLTAAALMLTVSCDFQKPADGYSTVRINLGTSLTKGLKAPVNITSVTLTVTGDDMYPINYSYTDIDTIELEVPSGNNRTFVLTAGFPLAAYRGTAETDITGDALTVNITMSLLNQKLVIPDAMNNRIVQIEDMAGTGWAELGAEYLSEIITNFIPYDIDYDLQGRLYIANNDSTDDVIIRVDDITGTNATVLVDDDDQDGINALAVDRTNNYIYFIVDGYALKRCRLDGTGEITLLTTTGLSEMRGIDVDPAGLLYIASHNAELGAQFSVYTPITEAVLAFQTYPSGYAIGCDIIVQGQYIYGCVYDYYILANSKIVQMQYIPLSTLSTVATYNPADPLLEGPRRFIHNFGNTLYFIDEEEWGFVDQIIKIDDMSGTNKDIYGEHGAGEGQFMFFTTEG